MAPRGPLPTDRTNGGAAFEVIGTDFAGPIQVQTTQEERGESLLSHLHV